MSDTPMGRTLILTTETPRGLAERVLILLLFGGLAAASTGLLYLVRDRPIDDRAVLALGCLQLLVFLLYPGVD